MRALYARCGSGFDGVVSFQLPHPILTVDTCVWGEVLKDVRVSVVEEVWQAQPISRTKRINDGLTRCVLGDLDEATYVTVCSCVSMRTDVVIKDERGAVAPVSTACRGGMWSVGGDKILYGLKEMYARPGCAFIGAVGMLFEVVPVLIPAITEQPALDGEHRARYH